MPCIRNTEKIMRWDTMREINSAMELLNRIIERVKFWVDDEETINLYKMMYAKEINNKVYSHKAINIEALVDNDYVNNVKHIEADVDISVKEFKRLLDYYTISGYVLDLNEHTFKDIYGYRLNGVVYACDETSALVRIRKPDLK